MKTSGRENPNSRARLCNEPSPRSGRPKPFALVQEGWKVRNYPAGGEVFFLTFPFIELLGTTLEAGKEHSYQMLFAGDTDFIGNMGNVVDCHEWVAPRLPVLLVTRNYPPCVARPEDGPEAKGWPLIIRENGMQFVTKDGHTITLTLRSDASRLH
jgi:hypothetical protein